MLIDFTLLFLFAGIPYYLLFEKTNLLGKEKTFYLSTLFLIGGIYSINKDPYQLSEMYIIIALIASIFSFFKARQTSNLYKLAYYILFFNAPMFFMLDAQDSTLYATSLLVTLFGIFMMGKYYERNYGSANYQSITGLTLVTPYAGLMLTIYLTALALYPPFPNSLMFLNGILNSEINLLWLIVVVVIFFGNFLIAVKVMARTVFGKPNTNVHYIDLNNKERLLHLIMFIILLALSAIGVKELLV